MAIAYIGQSYYQDDWASGTSVSPTASGEELWVACGYSAGSNASLTLDGAAMNDQYQINNNWNGGSMAWKIVASGSHTVAVGGNGSVGIAVMRFSGYDATPYLDVGAECIAYGDSAPYPNQDLHVHVGGLGTGFRVSASANRGYYIVSGAVLLGNFQFRKLCDWNGGEFSWGYRLSSVDSETWEVSWTQDSYSQNGNCAVHMSFDPYVAPPSSVEKYRRTRWNSYPYRRDRLGPVNIGGGAVGKGLWVPPGYNQLAVPGRQM